MNKELCFSFLMIMVIGLSSCVGNENINMGGIPQKRVRFDSFGFRADNNAILDSDYILTDTDCDSLCFFIHGLEDAPSLVPSYTGNIKQITVGGALLESGTTLQDYSRVVKYELEDYDGRKDSSFVKVLIGNGIPRIDITTEGGAEITSKTEYIKAKIKIDNIPEYGILTDEGLKIRGRGNATWWHPKKPYKIKFSEKKSPFGFPSNKDWVLLGNYTDRSLLRTSYMCEVSRALGIKYTVNSQHVDFYLNGEYKGTYLFTDHIEKAKNRVNVDNDGFFIEGDNYYQYEPLYFITDSFKIGMTFKYPDPDKNFVKDDDNYKFIQSFMNSVESAMLGIPKGDRTYRNLIDLNSFAKFIIAEEVLANFDSNFYYILKSRNSKLEMYPLWDFEWSLGLGETTETGWVLPPNKPKIDMVYWNRYPYTKYLYYDPEFVTILQDEWARFKPHIPKIREHIDSIRETLFYTQKSNFEKWPILDTFVSKELIALGDWNIEVDYINDFFENRVQWFDNYVMNEMPRIYGK